MVLASTIQVPWKGFSDLDARQQMLDLYEAYKAEVLRPTVRVKDWSGRPRESTSRTRTEAAEATEARARVRYLQGMMIRAVAVYFFAYPVFLFALYELTSFIKHGHAVLHPTIIIALIVAGGGLTVVASLAAITARVRIRRLRNLG